QVDETSRHLFLSSSLLNQSYRKEQFIKRSGSKFECLKFRNSPLKGSVLFKSDPQRSNPQSDITSAQCSFVKFVWIDLETIGMLNLINSPHVYTFGPTYRAENSNTSRHLAELWFMQ
ncbi:hypothetical protein R6Q59_012445, partial [Mikania micrantha]